MSAGIPLKLSHVFVTQGANELILKSIFNPMDLLTRHINGDWGDLCADDAALNDEAAEQGGRILSSYNLPINRHAGKIWIITEWDRSATTILLPDEY